MLANPAFTYHLKQSVQRDIPATAVPIRGRSEKAAPLILILENENALGHLESRMERSRLFRVELSD